MPTATAGANIAFVKYWGNLVPGARIPFNDTISMNLDRAATTTTVEFDDADRDRLTIDGVERTGPALERVSAHLDHVRAAAGVQQRARVVSRNTFPMGTGIASSASGFAALSLAAVAAAGLDLDEAQLSALARRGSGSAARSVPGGFVAWRADPDPAGSYAYTVAPADHWALRDVIAVVSRRHKAVGSSDGHGLATTSPFFARRLAMLPARIAEVRRAIEERDLRALGAAIEAEALELHAVAMTSRPALLYWEPGTMALLHQMARWRSDGMEVYFTLDAGPNVHLVCSAETALELQTELDHLDYVESHLTCRPGGPARLVEGSEVEA